MGNTGFNKETEVLTYEGWKSISDIKPRDRVVSYNIERGILEEDRVLDTIENNEVTLIKVSHKEMVFTTSPDQLWYGWKRLWAKKGLPRQKYYHKFSIMEANQEFNIINSAKYKNMKENPNSVNKNDMALLAWVLSDGYYKWSDRAEVTSCAGGKRKGVIGMVAQAQHKFYKEVEDVIEKVGMACTLHIDIKGKKKSPVNRYYFRSEEFRNFMDKVVGIRKNKDDVNWVEVLLRYNTPCLEEFLYHFWLADGDTKGVDYINPSKFIITQNKGFVCDAVAMLSFFRGNKITIIKHSGDKCKQIRSVKRAHSTMQEIKREEVGKDTTYDVLTNNGTFVIRQDSFISITCSSTFNPHPP